MAKRNYTLAALFAVLLLWAMRSHLRMECNEEITKLLYVTTKLLSHPKHPMADFAGRCDWSNAWLPPIHPCFKGRYRKTDKSLFVCFFIFF